MELNSRIYETKVKHTRLEPVFHTFEYPVYFYVFDLDELPTLSEKLFPLFGYNFYRPISLFDSDYLSQNISIRDDSLNNQTIKQKLFRKLEEKSVDTKSIARVELVTVPRYLGYSFNPVSFYYCYFLDSYGEEKIMCIVSEINNTFGEKHIYVHQINENLKDVKKRTFHVSPFNDLDLSYSFSFSDVRDKLFIRINIVHDGNDKKKKFLSQIFSTNKIEISRANIMKLSAKYPITAFLTFPRICYQAAKLHFSHKLPVYPKPNPQSEDTIALNTSPIFYSNSLKYSDSSELKDSTMVSFFLIHFSKWCKKLLCCLQSDSKAPKLKHITFYLPTKVPVVVKVADDSLHQERIELDIKNLVVFKLLVICIYSSSSSSLLGKNIVHIIRDCFVANQIDCKIDHLLLFLSSILFVFPTSASLFFPLEQMNNSTSNASTPSDLSTLSIPSIYSKYKLLDLNQLFGEQKGYIFSPSLFRNEETHVKSISSNEEWADSMDHLLHSFTSKSSVTIKTVLFIGCGRWNIEAISLLAKRSSYKISCVNSRNTSDLEEKDYPFLHFTTIDHVGETSEQFNYVVITDSCFVQFSKITETLNTFKRILCKDGRIIFYAFTASSSPPSSSSSSIQPSIQFSLLEKIKYNYDIALDYAQTKYFGSITSYAPDSISTENFSEVCKVVANDCFQLFPPLYLSSMNDNIPLLSNWNEAAIECGFIFSAEKSKNLERICEQMEYFAKEIGSSTMSHKNISFNFVLASSYLKIGAVNLTQIVLSCQ